MSKSTKKKRATTTAPADVEADARRQQKRSRNADPKPQRRAGKAAPSLSGAAASVLSELGDGTSDEYASGGGCVFDGLYRVPWARLTPEQAAEHRNRLTLQLNGKNWLTDAPLDPIEAFCATDTHLCVPRWYGITHIDESFVSLVPEGLPLGPSQFTGELDEPGRSQLTALNRVLESLRRHGCAQLCLPPGYGKTVTALKAVSVIGKRAMVVVHTSDLADQWVERARVFLPEVRCERVSSKTKPERMEQLDIAVFTVQAVLAWLNGARAAVSPFARRNLAAFGMLIVDESHHYNAPQFSQALPYLMRPMTLALSGTPYRNDGSHELLAKHVGGVTFSVRKEYSCPVLVQILSPVRKDDGDVPPPRVLFNGKPNVSAMTNDLCAHPRRNAGLVRAILAAAATKRTLVLGDRVEHLHALEALCKATDEACDTGVVTGKVAKATRLILRERRIVFATYHLYSEAMDDPTLGCVVFATNRSNVYQALCRVIRARTLGSSPVVVDVRDVGGVWYGMLNARMRLYKREGYTITNVDECEAPETPGPEHAASGGCAL